MEGGKQDPAFAAVVEALLATTGVTVGSGRRGFGRDALQIEGRIFAMARAGTLVLKLPSAKVAALVSSGDGEPFDAGKGRPMKEWVVVRRGAEEQWIRLATEALAFVGGNSETAKQPRRQR